jgi:hypothetical protein
MEKAKLYHKYPLSSILVYNVTTIAHFFIGALVLCYSTAVFGPGGIVVGMAYLTLSLVEMYVIMPLQVCTHCIYTKIDGGLCISGLNVVSKSFFKPAEKQDLSKRAHGLWCPNNLYIATLVLPILCGILLLLHKFNVTLLVLVVVVFVLLLVRFFYIIPVMACLHCKSKYVCPQAGQMGVREK